jgi:eukaryotic-like serine/threonine-protein kinase
MSNDDTIPPQESPTIAHTPSSGAGGVGPESVIGKYRLQQRIGAGGMGEVYEAMQLEPVRRRVALKLIKRGMDTERVVARFESERQALALMDHECIARVFDAGSTDEGRPYFVMEYVKGVPITEYCQSNRLDTRAKLKLFLRVCEGVQHAHQKGIIHRDIKPTNVLVTIQEAKTVPKIIDFGLAKATAHSLTDSTLFTELGQLVGTPEYMSPEQAEMSGLDVDTRTDVYALGVLLYELLVGALPYDAKALRQGGFDEIRRRLRDDEPPRPSTRISALSADPGPAARRPKAEAAAISKQLRGDLDWIVMKAMEKDRTRRYNSASDLAADVQRHLRNDPVLAGPPSTTYRMRKFVLRHKVGVLAASVVMLAVLLGILGTSIGLVRTKRAEHVAREEAETARQISDFLVGLFKVSDPSESVGNTITAREILDRGATRIQNELGNQPRTQARLMNTMGDVYTSLGLYDAARPLLEKSLGLRRASGGNGDLLEAESLADLANLDRLQANFAAAESLLLLARAVREKELGPEHPLVASTLCDLGVAYSRQGKNELAEPLFKRALEVDERALGPEHPEVARVLKELGIHQWRQGRYAEAEPLYKRALAIWEQAYGPEHLEVARTLVNLAIAYRAQGKYGAAVPLYQRALAIYEKVLGPEHPLVAGGLNNLALVYRDLGDYAAAEPLLARSLQIQTKRLGPDHPDVASVLNNLANMKRDEKDYAGAEPLYRRALAIREHALGPEHPEVAESLEDLGVMERERGNDQALAIYEVALGPDSDGVGYASSDLALLYERRREYPTAESYYKRAVQAFEKGLGADHPQLAKCLDSYAGLLRQMGRGTDAELLQDRAAGIRSHARSDAPGS